MLLREIVQVLIFNNLLYAHRLFCGQCMYRIIQIFHYICIEYFLNFKFIFLSLSIFLIILLSHHFIEALRCNGNLEPLQYPS